MSGLRVEAHRGPAAAPAAAAGTGLRTGAPLRYQWEASAVGALAHALPRFWEDREICADDELSWSVFPAFDTAASVVQDGYRAAAVSIELVFDDGRTLLTSTPTERDHTSSAPGDRCDLDFPDQWNDRRIPLAAFVGTRVVDARLVAAPPPARGTTASGLLEGWIDAPRIAPSAPSEEGSPAERVQTTRGSHSSPWRSRGNTQPATGVPHGHLHVAPATELGNPHWTYSWNAHGPGPHPALAGLLITRSPSIWIGDRAALAIRAGLTPDRDLGVAPEPFLHDQEHARPHRYRVTTLSGLRVDAAAGSAEVVADFTFPSPGRLVFCAPGAPLSHLAHERSADGGVLLSLASTLPSPHEADPLRGYYSVAVSGADFEVSEHAGQVIIEVSPTAGAVRVEVGGSLLSVAQASQARLRTAMRSVDRIAADARDAWDELLRIVDAPEADQDDRALIASDLYRLFLYPTEHNEDTIHGPRYASPTERVADDGPLATGRRIRSGRLLTDNGFWDTYRTAWPAFHLLAPERAGRLLDGMLEHVRADGWSPRWTAGTPLDAMVGTSLDVIAADAVASGVAGVDIETAYSAALRNASAASVDPRFGRRGMPRALALGYVPASHGESVSWTIEGAINDAGAAVLARELSRRAEGARAARLRADARYLAHRASAYRSLWDEQSRFFRPRDADGSWADEPFDPRIWGGGHTETNAWGSRFPAPHDGRGLAALFGGPRSFGDALEEYFSEAETADARFAGTYGQVIHEMPEARDIRRGMWALSNQPAHHVPWMFAFSDRPWRTSEILHDAVHRLFRGARIGQGFPGDEDNGEMSAWHLFAQLGFAPFQPGSGRLLITAPTLDRATLRPPGAESLEIRVHRRDAGDRHIRAVRWNGAQWSRPTVDVRDLHGGGLWEVHLGPAPAQWSEPMDSRPFFAPDGVDAVGLEDAAIAVAVDGVPLAGDASDVRPVRFASIIELEFGGPVTSHLPALLVLGLASAGTHSFDVDALVDGGWAPAARRRGEAWDWDQQVRPFEVVLPDRARALRVQWAGEPAGLTMVQLLLPRAE